MKGFGENKLASNRNNPKNSAKIDKDQIIKQAFKFHSEGNILEAVKCYKYCISRGFNDHRIYNNYGLILRSISRFREAEACLRKAVDINPEFASAYSNLGTVLRNIGKLKEAESCQRKAIEIDKDFAMAYSNLGNLLIDIGKLEEAELYLRKAIELKPTDKNFQANLINLLTLIKPEKIKLNNLFLINEEFRSIDISKLGDIDISDAKAIRVYKDGLDIYKKYNLNLETPFLQIYKKNKKFLNCKRHMFLFNEHKLIPKFCFECYKVQIEVKSVIELIKLFIVFNSFKIKNKNSRKCMIETRKNVTGFYKGLIYCSSLDEAIEISEEINIVIQRNIRTDLISNVKRGCSEYGLQFPQYKEISLSGKQPMDYKKNWEDIENEFDKTNNDWGKSNPSIEGFNLNNFLIMRNWIAYARKIGDKSVNKITHEEIKGSKEIRNLNRNFIYKNLQIKD